ncbi:MAG TPA: hypothetical protein VLE95_05275 [Chlamydiales bacterium]|nr:hypothetical protein [Chlamydiales bacterium]
MEKLHIENEELNLVSNKLSLFFELVPNPLLDDFLLLADQMTLYRNNLKNREFDKEAAQFFASGASEDQKNAAKPTSSKTDSSGCFGIIPISQQIIRDIGENDAVIAAPEAHRIIYENESIRILESLLMPGQIVPFHTHQWDSVILTIQGSKFTCNDGNTIIEEDWPPMAEKVQGSFQAHSYQNVGTTEFRALVFEFKK